MEHTSLLLGEFIFYFLGVFVSILFWSIHLLLRWIWPGEELGRVQRNLAKAGYIWVPDSKLIVMQGDDGVQKRNLLIVVAVLSILSWLGVLLSIAAILSLRRLKSPREKNVLASALAKKDDLSVEEIERLARSFRA